VDMLAHRARIASLDREVADPFSTLDARWRACCSCRLEAGANPRRASTARSASEQQPQPGPTQPLGCLHGGSPTFDAAYTPARAAETERHCIPGGRSV